jgi:hypothetical protein
MDTPALIMVVREKLDDLVEPYLVSDVDIVESLNRAQKEFVRSTYSTFVENTAPLIADSPWVEVPANVLIVRSVIHGDAQLRVVTSHEMELGYFKVRTTSEMTTERWTNWRSQTGTPRFAITDVGPGKLRLVPTPNAAATVISPTVTIEGYGVPDPMDLAGTPPNVPLQFLEDLATGALFHLYSNQDAELFNANQAQSYFQLWQHVIQDAQVALGTRLRVQQRGMRLPRGFSPAIPTTDFATPSTTAAGPDQQQR